ncbi:MAG: sigma-70 family RNA polymerase sigma factor [Planctomycetota bacterium]|nr:MAG: sigma-70 family RNA polymerase sigma factor [Planctomycetota bacterium]
MPTPSHQRITQLLDAAKAGDRSAARDLLPLVYEELRKLAAARMARLPAGQTLQATALVHEAYIRVVGESDPGWDSRAHFFGAAARAMRNILVDRARRKGRVRHGGDLKRVEYDEGALGMQRTSVDVLALDEALARLEASDARKAQIVSLRCFAGLSVDEIAQLLQVSSRTIERDWRFARAWLARELGEDERKADDG